MADWILVLGGMVAGGLIGYGISRIVGWIAGLVSRRTTKGPR